MIHSIARINEAANSKQQYMNEQVTTFTLAVDLGQSIDPTAIVLVEVTTRAAAHRLYWREAGREEHAIPSDVIVPPKDWYGEHGLLHSRLPVRIDVRHLERLALHTPYPSQVDYIHGLMRRAWNRGVEPTLVVDMTGVGRPVVDMFRRDGLRPIGVSITAGDRETRDIDDWHDWKVAKSLLVSRLQSAMHSGVLRISDALPEAVTLKHELANFRATISETGKARFGAREGQHDDLLLALALAVWDATRDRDYAVWGKFYV